jgi:hypothetical protein
VGDYRVVGWTIVRTVAAILVVGSALMAQSAAQTVTAAERARLAALLPDGSQFGARVRGAAAFYGKDLYRYIDGGADAYLKAGFVALAHREYMAGAVELEADVYDMGAAGRALARFGAERPRDVRGLAIGAGAYVDEGALNFAAGTYYVKLVAFGEAGKTAGVLEKLARAIVERMGGK